MRHAADSAEGDDVGDDGGNQEPWLAGDRQQNARAQNHANQHIDQNCQSQFHFGDYKILFGGVQAVRQTRTILQLPKIALNAGVPLGTLSDYLVGYAT